MDLKVKYDRFTSLGQTLERGGEEQGTIDAPLEDRAALIGEDGARNLESLKEHPWIIQSEEIKKNFREAS